MHTTQQRMSDCIQPVSVGAIQRTLRQLQRLWAGGNTRGSGVISAFWVVHVAQGLVHCMHAAAGAPAGTPPAAA
jgi:hypothetical protein